MNDCNIIFPQKVELTTYTMSMDFQKSSKDENAHKPIALSNEKWQLSPFGSLGAT